MNKNFKKIKKEERLSSIVKWIFTKKHIKSDWRGYMNKNFKK
jgi:hypothetical protein